MGDRDLPPPAYHFSKTLSALLRSAKSSLQFFRASCAGILKVLKGPEPTFLAHLSPRMDILAYCDPNELIEKYCIRKNGQFPSRIDHHDSLKSIMISKPSEKIRRLLFSPVSDATTLHDGALWGWTPDGVYLRILTGDVSMLLTLQEVTSLRRVFFPENMIDGEGTNG